MLAPTNKSKEIKKKNTNNYGVKSKSIKSIAKNSDGYDKKYMKIKFSSDNGVLLNKTNDNRCQGCFSRRQQILSESFLR